ncbi:MAG: hypothetical protein IAA31_03970 [Candidatus Anaerobiospirillum merdipullorum]|uniref:Uncharacterized protein n=1 Tax=Candidatus Anaerobiospirillum merdipullorum TaxID=2838450 RepID=A0A9E2KM81_9GAMM|nr:hypothetical protein [Candidatus Anaerobiospirillum merdipullorum]
MLIDEIKASLAMENLHLTAAEEQLLRDFAAERISFAELLDFVKNAIKKQKAA